MDKELIGLTLQTIGHLLIAYTAIRVHYRVWREHQIDEKVFETMKKEQIIGAIGVVFIITGYIFHII